MNAVDSILNGAPPPVVELIPHRAPMLFVDALVTATEQAATCSFGVTAKTACMRGGRLSAIYALEAMAQAAAVHLGALARWRGEPQCGGYLVGVRDVVLACPGFVPGDALAIEVRRTFGSDRLASYDCRVGRGGVDVATATVNVLRHPA